MQMDFGKGSLCNPQKRTAPVRPEQLKNKEARDYSEKYLSLKRSGSC